MKIETLAGAAGGAVAAGIASRGIVEALNSPRIQSPKEEDKFHPPFYVNLITAGGAVVGAAMGEKAPKALHLGGTAALALTLGFKLARVNQDPARYHNPHI